ncbi:MAG: TPM domain-containing protein [Prevotellaceae bacterium]|jgi:uncharacterized protein|nr:TPM domain-containing protein [Prevotellaceae bacterium]
MKKKIILSVLCFACAILCNARTGAVVLLDEGFVSDSDSLFTPAQEQELNALITGFKAKTDNEIAVITVNSCAPYSNMNDFSRDLSNNWQLWNGGEAQNSLLIIVSRSLHTVRITTAYGTEKLIQNDVCRRIIDTQMLPAYAADNYFAGTKQGLLALIKAWQ